jgi:2,4-dichlorophenol 6-monooxygenase
VTLRVVGPSGSAADYVDIEDTWQQRRGVSEYGALLLRPDRHIAWLVHHLPEADPAAAGACLRGALATVLSTRKADG